jgi:hypothetical protein
MEAQWAQLITLVISQSGGPGAGVIVALLAMGGFIYFTVKHVFPQQDKLLDAFIHEGRENRETFMKGIETIHGRVEEIEDDLKGVKDKIGDLGHKIDTGLRERVLRDQNYNR